MRWSRYLRLLTGLAASIMVALALTNTDASAQASPHGDARRAFECSACHTTGGWQSLRDPLAFDHEKDAGFALAGRHADADCAGCHLELRFDQPRLAQTECSGCHLDVHQGTQPRDCASCHNTESFADAAGLEQHARGRFPLTGVHIQISCEACHIDDTGGSFAPRDTDCYSCHAADYEATQRVNHAAAGIPRQCMQCHSTVSWLDAVFDHATSADFPLEGMHTQVECAKCHTGQAGEVRFNAAGPFDCLACHRVDYDHEHSGSGFPLECAGCHTVNGWDREPFDHVGEANGFALLGMHAQAPCTDCHAPPDNDLKFDAAGQEDCVACHQTDYDSEHTGTGYPVTCSRCHSVNGWTRADFNHAEAGNGFPLLGSHRTITCIDCHVPPDLALKWATPANADDCLACHRPDYDSEHTGSGYPTTCLSCHDVNDWSHAVFDHVANGNGFALTGTHSQTQCTVCHGANNTLLFPVPAGPDDCAACHQADYDTEHIGSGFPTTCGDCHTTSTFTGATFDHTTTGFTLAGAHVAADCSKCHGPNNALLFPTPADANDCVACHRPEYDAEHTGTNFAVTCGDCHTTSSFKGATFDHSTTGFALAGAHVAATCSSCHGPNNTLLFPAPTSATDCVACHQADYDAEHTGTGFPTTCADCHTSTTFTGATFDHSTTSFNLVGAHVSANCSACHGPNDTLLFPTPSGQNDCIACHQADYNTKHTGSGYPTSCLDCHDTNTFQGAVFDHTQYFPINSGSHSGKWNSCADCHQSQADYSVFTCLSCHEHRKSAMDDKHSGEPGYVYASVACLNCHPTGRH